MLTRRHVLMIGLVCLAFTWTAGTVRAGDEEKKVERIGASLCKAVRSMDGEPILKSYSVRGNKLNMEVYWFGLLSGKKYTSTITITFDSDGDIDNIKYDDNCIIPAYDLTYVEKWRRAQNK